MRSGVWLCIHCSIVFLLGGVAVLADTISLLDIAAPNIGLQCVGRIDLGGRQAEALFEEGILRDLELRDSWEMEFDNDTA